MKQLFFALVMGLVLPTTLHAQTAADYEPSADTAYYDFWPGVWHQVIDGKADPHATRFIVRRGPSAVSYLEDWIQVDDGIERRSFAIRAWDQVNNRWMFTWISENALYQIWSSERVRDTWYIVKEWNINGRVFLTRQAWIPDGPDKVTRVFERSFDNRATWELVNKTHFARVSGDAE